MKLIRLFSPGKVNLFFKIIQKLPSGYHEILSRMQSVSFGDIVTVSLSQEDSLTCNIPTLEHPSNLAIASVRLFRFLTGITDPVHIHLEKQLPLGAGLGGGSSNAATVLFALYTLFNVPLKICELQKESAILGADVPFFFSSGQALCTGIGTTCINEPLSPYEFVLYTPSIHVSTPRVFSHVRLPSTYKQGTSNPTLGDNDLMPITLQLYPELLDYVHELERMWSPYPVRICMSGSGSSLFVPLPTLWKEDQQIIQTIRDTKGQIVHSMYKPSLDAWYAIPNHA